MAAHERRLRPGRRPRPVRPLRRRARRGAPGRPRRARRQGARSSARRTSIPRGSTTCMFGNANGAGEDNRNVARMAVLLAGLPTSVPGTTINRLCGSSLDAAMQASRAVETGDADVVLVGGVESMSRAPWVVLKPEKGFPAGPQTMHSTTLGWRMVNPEMPDQWTISLGESTEKLAGIYDIAREAQDEFALRSHQRAAAAWDDGFYDDWVVAGARHRARARRGHPRRHVAGEARQAQAGVRQGRHRDRRQRLAAQRRRRRGARRVRAGRETRGPRAARPDRRPRHVRRRPRRLRHRPGRGGEPRARARRASAGTTSTSSSSTRRSPRSRSPAWRSGRSSTPTSSTPTAARSRSGTRSARPARASSARSRTRCKRTRRALGRRGDLHRRRPGTGGGGGEGVTLQRRRGSHPPMDYAGYKSTALRHPKQPLIALPHRLTEVTAPVLGEDRVGELDHDLTRQHEGEPIGQRIIVHGHVKEDDGRPVPRHAGRGLAGQRRRPLPPPLGQLAVAARPELHRRRALRHRQRAATSASSRSSRAPTRGATTRTPGGPRTSTSACSAARSRSGS